MQNSPLKSYFKQQFVPVTPGLSLTMHASRKLQVGSLQSHNDIHTPRASHLLKLSTMPSSHLELTMELSDILMEQAWKSRAEWGHEFGELVQWEETIR